MPCDLSASALFAAGPEVGCPSNRKRERVGTRVRESTYDASIANTTARAMGVKRYREAPDSKTTGKKTIQMAKVATIAGTAIWLAPSRIATVMGLPISKFRLI